MPRRSSRVSVAALLALCAVALAVRVGWVLAVDPAVPEVGDASAYHLLADGLADGDGYVRPFDRVLLHTIRPTAEYPPLHPTVLAAAAAAGVDGVRGQRLWLSLFGAASVGVTGLLARRLSRGSDLAMLIAAGIAAVHPLWFQADATLMPETLAALLGGLVALGAAAVVARPRTAALVGLGAVVGLAALTRAEALLLLPAVVVPAAVVGARGSRVGRRVAVTAAVPVVVAAGVVAPWLVRDAVRFHTFVPISTNSGSMLDGANCPGTYRGSLVGYWSYAPDCFEGFTQDELAAGDEATVAAAHRRQGIDFATAHVGRWPVVATARLARTLGLWHPGQQADLAALEGRRQGAEVVGYVLLWATVVLGAIGARWLRRRGAAWWLPVVLALVVWGSTALSYGNPRFLALAQPALVALAACGVVAVVERRHAPRSTP